MAGTTLTAYSGSLVQAAVREQTSSQQVGLKGTWLGGFQKGLLESAWGFFSPTFSPHPSPVSSESGSQWHTILNWTFQACASGWQQGLPFRAGARQSLRVWWKDDEALMELPYGSEYLLEGV